MNILATQHFDVLIDIFNCTHVNVQILDGAQYHVLCVLKSVSIRLSYSYLVIV
jgi:hypothetical protein